MRILLAILLLTSLSFAKSSIDKRIKTTNNKLKNYDKRYKNAHKKLSKSAKSILNQQKKMLQLDLKLEKLNTELANNLALYERSQNSLSMLQEQKSSLTQVKEGMRNELSRLIAKQLSLEIILQQRSFSDVQAHMRGEIFSALSRLTNQELKSIKHNISDVLTQEEQLSLKMKNLTYTMQKIDTKRKNVLKFKKEQKSILAKLSKERKSYKKDLEKSLTTKANLRKMLKKLQIIKEDQKKKAKRLVKEKAARLAAQKAGKKLDDIKVKKQGSSYEKVSTRRYRGKKTISPLKGYSVMKKFGPYVDPVYDIKIFNDSVSLKPKTKNAIVKAIFNGKVIISKRNKLLGNFIIIEHAKGLHSIYAHLDKVAPTIKQGKRIKKGTTIGRVNHELMFQITQKNHHINPLEVIY
jgi:septal ring factor EnvC (AmiA/AmiB activator)